MKGFQDMQGEHLPQNAHGTSFTIDGQFADFPEWAFEDEFGQADGAPNQSNWRPLEELHVADLDSAFAAMYFEDKDTRRARILGGSNEELDVPDAVFHGNWVRGAWDDHFFGHEDDLDGEGESDRDPEPPFSWLEFPPSMEPSHSAPLTSRHRSRDLDDGGWRYATRTVHTREGKVQIERCYRSSNCCGWHGSWKRSRRDYARQSAQG